ncbi:flap endonuclease GEN homolog 1 [Triplophysa dalaica]|uniref:flap endonuclease GEN homolog 1 n=1 Tax=Triplophysa dalaica TaxID=1582913 RepID=UPI0024DFAB61|nr:flap endonuclease GEN homolog 1 [Triplophysa dalaica]XP_056604667.1 flap endonuclease GEN homolog 1 [Triplophysa dalaica]XP_056604668.1 flap endonuclease GEN homolog 1 [Triplophysa dalaica]
MGVSELWSILDPVRQCVPLYSLSGKTLAVDLSLWVCEAQHVQGMMGKVTKPHLRNLFFRMSSLTLMGVKLVFVMEGDAPKLKAETMSKRTEMRFGKVQSKPAAVKTTGRSRFKAVLRECGELLDCLGVPWVTAAGEAEAMCAFLDWQGVVDGCITNDGDAFLYGAQTVYRNFNMNTKDPQVDCYQMSRVKAELGLSRETLVGLAIFLGCDYIPKGVAGVGKEQTLKLIHNLKGQTLLQKFREWESDRSERSEVTVKKVTHCLVCRHPGSAKTHERSGCVFCKSERFCSPQDYDSRCPCDWHRIEHTRQASSIEANIRKKTLACERFPFTEIIDEFLVTKDKPAPPFRRRKPNLLLMQNFALEKMDWPKHYSSEKVLVLMTYTELMNKKHNRGTAAHIQPIRIYKARVRNGVNCFEVIWKKPDHYVFAEGCDEHTEVRTVEEESLFTLAYPHIVQDFNRERAEAQENKTKKKKPKAPKEKPRDSHDVMSDLFDQMSLHTAADSEHSDYGVQKPSSDVIMNPTQSKPPETPQNPASPTSPPHNSVSALIGQLQLSSIDWDSSSFMASPSQQSPSNKTELRSAGDATDLTVTVERSLKERLAMKNVVKCHVLKDGVQKTHKPSGSESLKADSNLSVLSKVPLCPKTQAKVTKPSTDLTDLQTVTAKPPNSLHLKPSVPLERKAHSVCVRHDSFSDDSDAENRPRSQKHKVKVTSKPQRPDKTSSSHQSRPQKLSCNDQLSAVNTKTPKKHTAVIRSTHLHHVKMDDDDEEDDPVDSPLPLAERLKIRFAK